MLVIGDFSYFVLAELKKRKYGVYLWRITKMYRYAAQITLCLHMLNNCYYLIAESKILLQRNNHLLVPIATLSRSAAPSPCRLGTSWASCWTACHNCRWKDVTKLICNHSVFQLSYYLHFILYWYVEVRKVMQSRDTMNWSRACDWMYYCIVHYIS